MSQPYGELKLLTDGEWTARELMALLDVVSTIYNSFKALNDPKFADRYIDKGNFNLGRPEKDESISMRRKIIDFEQSLDHNEKIRIARIRMSSPGDIIFKGTKREIHDTERVIASSKNIKHKDKSQLKDNIRKAIDEAKKDIPQVIENILVDALRFIMIMEEEGKLNTSASRDREYNQ
jgi:hypothetical protein